MVEEIRQDDKVILSSEDGFSEEMGLKPGIVSHYRDGVLYKNGTIPEL